MIKGVKNTMTDSFNVLDMAVDMSDRYGIAVEDAYAFACDAMEGSLKDPDKRRLRELGRGSISNPNKNGFADINKKYKRDNARLIYRRRTTTSKDDKARISNIKANNDYDTFLAKQRIAAEYDHQRQRANRSLNKNIDNKKFTIE